MYILKHRSVIAVTYVVHDEEGHHTGGRGSMMYTIRDVQRPLPRHLRPIHLDRRKKDQNRPEKHPYTHVHACTCSEVKQTFCLITSMVLDVRTCLAQQRVLPDCTLVSATRFACHEKGWASRLLTSVTAWIRLKKECHADYTKNRLHVVKRGQESSSVWAIVEHHQHAPCT